MGPGVVPNSSPLTAHLVFNRGATISRRELMRFRRDVVKEEGWVISIESGETG
jgi:hypothetical protein